MFLIIKELSMHNNLIDLIINCYGTLYNRKNVPFFLLTPFRKIIRAIGNYYIPKQLMKEKMVSNREQTDVIVSFTSFPARINSVHLVVRCMMRQTVLPKKIILWLAKSQFPNGVPASLSSLVGDMFEIRMVENDFRSHKKYCYAFKEFKNNIVVLIDDDIFYESTMLETLLREHKKRPDTIICRYGSEIKYNKDGSIPPFSDWWYEYKHSSDSPDFFLGTGGGSLFQPGLLVDKVCDTVLAIKLTPLADDIWINAMIRLSGLKIYKVECGLLLQITSQQSVALKHTNTAEGKNEEQMDNIINYFSNNIGVNPFKQKMS